MIEDEFHLNTDGIAHMSGGELTQQSNTVAMKSAVALIQSCPIIPSIAPVMSAKIHNNVFFISSVFYVSSRKGTKFFFILKYQ